ncbi:hypothetical protein D3C72_2068870 [compost metagenome]
MARNIPKITFIYSYLFIDYLTVRSIQTFFYFALIWSIRCSLHFNFGLYAYRFPRLTTTNIYFDSATFLYQLASFAHQSQIFWCQGEGYFLRLTLFEKYALKTF